MNSNLQFSHHEIGELFGTDESALVAVGVVLGGAAEAAVEDDRGGVGRMAALGGDGVLDGAAVDDLAFAGGEDRHTAIGKVGDERSRSVEISRRAFDRRAERAEDFDDEVFPFGSGHRFPFAL